MEMHQDCNAANLQDTPHWGAYWQLEPVNN